MIILKKLDILHNANNFVVKLTALFSGPYKVSQALCPNEYQLTSETGRTIPKALKRFSEKASPQDSAFRQALNF